jgi:hypothetical protein
MKTRYAEPIAIPRLKQKLGALYLISRNLDDAQLGRLFRSDEEPDGLTGKAVRNWIYGDDKRLPDHVPAGRLERLTEIFRDRLPQVRTLEEVRAMLLAPTEREILLALLSGGPEVDWLTRVLAAAPGQARLVRAERPGVMQVTTRRRAIESIQGQYVVPLREPFRLELDAATGWLCIVQWGRSGWFGMELADHTVAFRLQDTPCRIPPAPPYFEEDEPGARRYVLMRTQVPFPSDVIAVLSSSARTGASLDANVLVRLAHVAGASGVDMSVLDVLFGQPWF